MRYLAAALAAILVLAAFLTVTRVPAGRIAFLPAEGRVEVLEPGFHLVRPFGPRPVSVALDLPAVNGETEAILADGVRLHLSFTISGRIDPGSGTAFYRASAGGEAEALLKEAGTRAVRNAAAARTSVDFVNGILAAGATERAAGLLQPAGVRDAKVEVRCERPDSLLALAQALAPARLAGTIRPAVDASIASGKPGWEALTALGLVLESERDLRGAEQKYLDALTISPTAAPPMAQLVALYGAVGEFTKLERILAAALEADPSSLSHLNWLSATLMRQERLTEAEKVLERALALAPDDPLLLNNLAGIRLKQGRGAEAIEALRKAAAVAPGDPQTPYNLGVALCAAGRNGEGLKVLLDAEKAGPPRPALLHAIAGALRRSGDAPRAETYEKKARDLETPAAAP